MRKYFNFRNFGIACAAVIVSVILSSYTYHVGSVTVNVSKEYVSGHDYIIATTSQGGVAITHAPSCRCGK